MVALDIRCIIPTSTTLASSIFVLMLEDSYFPTRSLPPELLDEIFACLRTDKPALSACSLVSRSWSLNAQKHLFSFIRLTPKNAPTKPHAKYDDLQVPDFEAFAQAIRALSALAPCVRELSIEGTPLPYRLVTRRHWNPIDTFRSSNDPPSNPWQHRLLFVSIGLDVVLSVAQSLPCLRNVTLMSLVVIAIPLPEHDTIVLNRLELKTVGIRQPENVFDMFLVFRPADVDLSFFSSESAWKMPEQHVLRGVVAETWTLQRRRAGGHQLFRSLLHTPFSQHAKSFDVCLGSMLELFALSEIIKSCGSNFITLVPDMCDFSRTGSEHDFIGELPPLPLPYSSATFLNG